MEVISAHYFLTGIRLRMLAVASGQLTADISFLCPTKEKVREESAAFGQDGREKTFRYGQNPGRRCA
jgi:hypothetical protein